MRITWLLEVSDQLWGGVKVALEDANWLHRRGHTVTVVSRSGPPPWMRLECAFRQVPDFHPERLPDADVLIGTFWTTVPWAAAAGRQKGVPVHFCQGYEGDNPENVSLRERIEAVYRLPGVQHLTISPHLTSLLQRKFGIAAREVVYAVDHAVHHAGEARPPGTPLRVGLVGPWQIAWKDLPTGYEACRRAFQAGQKLVLVRATNTTPDPRERDVPFPVEWHQQVPPAQMGEFYRSLDVFLGTSCGAEEGFFLPAIEAMANGVPCVLTDVPCFRNHQQRLGNDSYALFVPPRDPAAMAEALVIAGRLPDVRATLRASGLALASHYHPDRHGEQLEHALHATVGRAAGAAPAASSPTTGGKPALRLVGASQAAAPSASGAEATDPLTTLGTQLQHEAQRRQHAGEHEAAARAWTAACLLAPGDDAVRHAAATAAVRAGDAELALQLYAPLVRRGVDDEALHVGRGHALHALGRMDEAAQAFRAALAVGVRCADAYNRLGVVLFQAGDVKGARQSFEKALVLEPGHGDARANLTSLPAA
ncbi:MAG: tetratricopeptide repeat protein [Planctomycetes bacterium]|nr:tetratricopeptide repeat protein [Planctomycetota bacterium]